MAAVCTGRELHVHDLPSTLHHAVFAPTLREPVYPSAGPSLVSGIARSSTPALEEVLPLAEVERRAILNALAVTRGDRTTAAQLLGIGRTTLYRRLKEYGVDDAP
jgi:transcriptional regulator of acetoin/glycerol metabolism